MFIRPDDAVTTALARIAKSAEWEVVEAWLKQSRETCVQASLSEAEAKCRQAQGAMLAIDELIKATRASVESATRR